MTDDQKILLYQQGTPIRRIAEESCSTFARVRSLLVTRGVVIRKRGQTPIEIRPRQQVEDICTLYKQGKTAIFIGQKLGISYRSILKILRSERVDVKTASSYRSSSSATKQGIRDDYLGDMPVNKILRDRNVSDGVLYRTLKEFGTQNRGGRQKHFNLDEAFFANIDSFEKAYLFGWLCSDGHNGKNERTVEIALQEKDGYILQLFSCFLSQGSIPIRPATGNKLKFSISSKKMSADLVSLGCLHDKTNTLMWPRFHSVDLERWFLLGFFDGDGHVGLYKSGLWKGKEYVKGIVELYSTKSVCDSIQSLLSLRDIQSSVFPRKGCYAIRFADRHNIYKFYSFVYDGAQFCLKRKHDKFIEIFKRHLISCENLWEKQEMQSSFDKLGIKIDHAIHD